MANNWPLQAADLRKALEYDVGADDAGELALFIAAACERIDTETGRDAEPTRHEIGGNVPIIFVMAARYTAKLWWKQEKGSGRNRPTGEDNTPMGADLPRKVQAWLAPYPPRLFIADEAGS